MPVVVVVSSVVALVELSEVELSEVPVLESVVASTSEPDWALREVQVSPMPS